MENQKVFIANDENILSLAIDLALLDLEHNKYDICNNAYAEILKLEIENYNNFQFQEEFQEERLLIYQLRLINNLALFSRSSGSTRPRPSRRPRPPKEEH